MFTPASFEKMVSIPNNWDDQGKDDNLGKMLEQAELEKEFPSTLAARGAISMKIGAAWDLVRQCRNLADKGELSDDEKERLRATMWALEQFDIS